MNFILDLQENFQASEASISSEMKPSLFFHFSVQFFAFQDPGLDAQSYA
jgi:hypothetical protein